MRRPLHRPPSKLRPFLCLEALEDRRVPSAGGLLSTLTPLAVGNAPAAASTSSPPALLSPVTTTVQDLTGGIVGGLPSPVASTVEDVAAGLVGAAQPAGPTTPAGSTGILGVQLNLSVDVLFVHLDNVQLNVAVAPTGQDQPLLNVGVGATVGVGSQTGGVLNVAPEVNLDVGGSNGVTVGIGSPGQVGGVAVPPEVPGVPGAPTGLPTPPSPPSVPALVDGGSGSGVASGNTTPPASTNDAQPNQPPAPPVVNVADPSQTGGSNPAASAVLAATHPAPASAAVIAGQEQDAADGAAGSLANTPAPVASTAVSTDNGGASDPVAPPVLAGVPALRAVANPDAEASGLTTRFQPFGLGHIRQALLDLAGRVGPQSGWLSTLLARLAQWTPWLAGAVFAGVAYNIRRRRRKAGADDRPAGDPVGV